MRILGNLIWLVFGGLEAAIGYFTGSLAMALTIVGIPWAMQTFKIGLLCLWPFGAKIENSDFPPGCLPMVYFWRSVGWTLSCSVWTPALYHYHWIAMGETAF